jgi:glycosyltransferase involved in cell wall biosynthesis
MRVLLATPYSPTARHDHAAGDLAAPLVQHLSREVELFVYAPQQRRVEAAGGPGPQYLAGTAPGRGAARHLSGRPSWVRREWTPAATAEVLDHVARLRPQVLHCEYLQAAEAVLAGVVPSVVALHDCSGDVQRRLLAATGGPRRLYRWAEAVRTERLERQVLAAAGAVVALSRRDANRFQLRTRRVVVTRPGVTLPALRWSPTPGGGDTVLFFGALWRSANIRIAVFLVRRVLPLVWRRRPDVTLCLAGARPGPEIRGLAGADRRVRVCGYVDDLDALVASSALVLAPNLVGGGIQLKVLRCLALGCPLVTSPDAADAVGARDGVHLLVGGDAAQLAEHVLRLLGDPQLAARLGGGGRELVRHGFDWRRTAADYLGAYRQAAGDG